MFKYTPFADTYGCSGQVVTDCFSVVIVSFDMFDPGSRTCGSSQLA